MTYSEYLTQLSLCLKAMLEHCKHKDWASLSESEKERENLVAKLKSIKPDNSPNTIQLINEVIQLNKDVMNAAEKNKDDSEKSLLEIKRNMKKTAQYYSE